MQFGLPRRNNSGTRQGRRVWPPETSSGPDSDPVVELDDRILVENLEAPVAVPESTGLAEDG